MSGLDFALRVIEVLLLLYVAVIVTLNHTILEWLKNVLIPFMASLTRFINPEKK